MKKQTFTFQKLETGGILHVEGTSEKSARARLHLSGLLWRLLSPLPSPPPPPEE